MAYTHGQQKGGKEARSEKLWHPEGSGGKYARARKGRRSPTGFETYLVVLTDGTGSPY